MSDFLPNNRQLREMLIFFSQSERTAAGGNRKIKNVYGDTALSEKMCCDWFHRIKHSNLYVDDRLCEGKTKSLHDAESETLLDQYSCQMQKRLALALEATCQAICKRLNALGMN